jgi:16S rRNA (guanine527-N7)-methyltransferase
LIGETMSQSHVPDFVSRELGDLNIEASDSELDLLGRYLDQLLDANQRMNLTAVRDRDDAWRKHVIDSLTLLPWLDGQDVSAIVDVGSGGGLPGVPLAIVLPQAKIVMIESTGKKVRFIEQVIDALALGNAKVVQLRAETAGQDPQYRERFDVAVCRAVGPMPELLEYTLPLVRVGGRMLAMKGPRLEKELPEATTAMDRLGAGAIEVYGAYPAAPEREHVIAVVEKIRHTPRSLPRSPGTPKHDPL